jgi:hypothetical protein
LVGFFVLYNSQLFFNQLNEFLETA